MQSENKFDQISKRLAVAVSRRSLLRSLSLALAGAVLPWRKASGQDPPERSSGLPLGEELVPVTKTHYFEINCEGGGATSFCVTAVSGPNFSGVAIDSAADGRACLIPADLLVKALRIKREGKSAKFAGKDVFERGLAKNKAWILATYPSAHFYSCKDEKTGEVTQHAFCLVPLRLDELVHKNETAHDLIIYKRDPNPKEIVDSTTEVQCGGMSTALKNAIPLQKPTRLVRLKDQEDELNKNLKSLQNDEGVPHATSSVRLNSTNTSAENQSGHKRR